jgi:hypothetical protein
MLGVLLSHVLFTLDIDKKQRKFHTTLEAIHSWLTYLRIIIQGNVVYAEISSNLVAEKSPPIQVNKIYEIRHFKILPARSLYKPVEANFMI